MGESGVTPKITEEMSRQMLRRQLRESAATFVKAHPDGEKMPRSERRKIGRTVVKLMSAKMKKGKT